MVANFKYYKLRFERAGLMAQFVGYIMILALSAGCSKSRFESSKSQYLATTSLFSSSGGDSESSQVNQAGAQGSSFSDVGGLLSQIGAPSVPGSGKGPNSAFDDILCRAYQYPAAAGTNVVVNLSYMCSNAQAGSSEVLAEAKNIKVELFVQQPPPPRPENGKCSLSDMVALSGNEKSMCSFNVSGLAADMLKNKKLDINGLQISSHCQGLSDGNFKLKLTGLDSSKTGSLLSTFVTKSGAKWLGVQAEVQVLLDYNPDNVNGNDPSAKPRVRPDIACDQKASPLVIRYEVAANAGPLRLSSPKHGVLFDILGENADPVPHTPQRISWIRSAKYLFITLPDAQGRVQGIDQMFGDNTRGPDGQFAYSGYEALAKYDGTSADGTESIHPRDGFIDESDAVYERLRLWQDINFDGVAQSSELFPMRTFGIARVDLNYDASYSEQDRWGNETKFKSVAEGENGAMYLLFDLWFKYGF